MGSAKRTLGRIWHVDSASCANKSQMAPTVRYSGTAKKTRAIQEPGVNPFQTIDQRGLICSTGLWVTLLLSGCSKPEQPTPAEKSVPASSEAVEPAQSPTRTETNKPSESAATSASTIKEFQSPGLSFRDVAEERGISFTYQNGANGRLLMVESIGGGASWLDYDADDLPDVFLTQGGQPDSPNPSERPSDMLFRHGVSGQFSSPGALTGLTDSGYSQGATAADFDNDGFSDLYITNVGTNVLYRNNGDGTFSPVPGEAVTPDARWSSSAAWADLDQDGLLDLYVCNYLRYDPYDPLECLKDGHPALCHPRQLEHWPDECFRNLGDGRFERVTEKWGLSGPGNKALGVAIADFTGDHRPDIYVANDTTANFLFVRQESGTFEDEALRRGCALSRTGDAQASMGVAVADYDGNGFLDILLSHFTGEANTLYQNRGDSGMQDVSALTDMRQISFPKLGFGIVMQDFNCDGQMDCLVANGHIDERNADFDGYEQVPQLLSFDGRKWHEQKNAGDYFQRKLVGRGIALADLDADGDLDALVVHQNKPASLLVNEADSKGRGHWLQLRFIGKISNREGIGCHVTVKTDSKQLATQLAGGTSFASTHQPLVEIGLGEQSGPVDLEILWPSGITQTMLDVNVDQILRLQEPPASL